jgi:hypothetical protein
VADGRTSHITNTLGVAITLNHTGLLSMCVSIVV